MNLLLVYSASALLGLNVMACGGAGGGSAKSVRADLPARDEDHDIDSLGQGRYDSDNDADPTFGPAASTSERGAIVALIKRYYAAAAADDGVRACSMLNPPVAEAIVEGHYPHNGQKRLRGTTCSQIASQIFAQLHSELVADVSVLRVGWIQLQARQAVTLVYFGPTREMIVRVHRTDDGWEMNTLLDDGPW